MKVMALAVNGNPNNANERWQCRVQGQAGGGFDTCRLSAGLAPFQNALSTALTLEVGAYIL